MTDVLPDKIKEEIKNQIPLRTLGETKDVANLVKFLSSEESSCRWWHANVSSKNKLCFT